MRTSSYPSDVTDEQWALIEPHIPVYPGGRPRTTNLRDVVDAIFYVLRNVRRMFADNKYHNHDLYAWVETNARWELVVVRRPDGQKGWVKLPLRWTVERTFAGLGRCRRLTKDREQTVLSSEAFIKLAMIHLMPNRLEPKETDPEFQYHTAV